MLKTTLYYKSNLNIALPYIIRYIIIVTFVLIIAMVISCNSDDDVRLVFIGDSITYRWDVKRMFPTYTCLNQGINSCKIENCLGRKIEYPDDIVILWIGTNNLNPDCDNAKEMKPLYEKLFDSIKAKRLIVLSIAPRREKNFTVEIPKVNQMLKECCELRNIQFVDVFNNLQEKGLLNPNYASDDVHLNSEGLRIVAIMLYNYL